MKLVNPGPAEDNWLWRCQLVVGDESPSWQSKVSIVGINFSGNNHYTSAGIVVVTTKINSNIKEAKATSLTPVSKPSAPSAGSEAALSVGSSNYNLSGITTLGFTTSAGLEPQTS